MKYLAADPLPRIPSANSMAGCNESPREISPKPKRVKRKKDKTTQRKSDKKTKSKRRVRSRSCPGNVLAEKTNHVIVMKTNIETSVSHNIKLPKISSPKGDLSAKVVESTYTRKPSSAVSTLRVARAATVAGFNLTPSPATQDDASKKAKKVPVLTAIKPDNQETEREKFFKSGYEYNPQFVYKYSTDPVFMEKMGQPSSRLLHIAIKIMRTALTRHGSYEKFEDESGGKKLNRMQILEATKRYLQEENLEAEVQVRLSEDLVSRACMTRLGGKPTLQVRTHNIRENWIRGLLFHEIGTHFLRGANNRQQAWYHWKKRKELGLRPLNPTEEGLASLHSLIFRPLPLLWKSSLLYYVTYKASEMSFCELFKDVGQFVKDPAVRWEYCLRAKRGQTDTSQHGTFCKDQVYLRGALDILKHRHDIDFHLLVRCGKVDYRDLDLLKDQVNIENTRIPQFMDDLKTYRHGLNAIVKANGLADDDFSDI